MTQRISPKEFRGRIVLVAALVLVLAIGAGLAILGPERIAAHQIETTAGALALWFVPVFFLWRWYEKAS